jgi:hypothetical protein
MTTTEQELLDRIEMLERQISQLHHPCMTRVEDLQGVIIRLQADKLEAIREADMKKQKSSTTKLQMVANSIEFGHSHDK